MSGQWTPTSKVSYGESGLIAGEVVSINDPEHHNRVRVRLRHYQDDKSQIPDDRLPWHRVNSGFASFDGASATHNLYVGAIVNLQAMGSELVVMGATSGDKSDERYKGGQSQGAGESLKPDVPNIVRSKDQGGADVVQQKRDPKTEAPVSKPDERKTYDDDRDKAPFDKGDAAKVPTDKSVAVDKLSHGSDLLDVIKGLDGNASGAVKAALDVIKNLRSAGFGTSKETIGAGPLAATQQQYVDDFGTAVASAIPSVLAALRSAIVATRTLSAATFSAARVDGTLLSVANSLAPATLGVSTTTVERLDVLATDGTPADVPEFLDLFSSGVHEGFSNLLQVLDSLANTLGGASGLAHLFYSAEVLVQVATDLAFVAAYCGSSAAAIGPAGGGLIGAVLTGGLAAAAALLASSRPSPAVSAVQKATSMFQGNPVALSEIASGGQLNPKSLLGIALKYAKKKVNDPSKTFAQGVK